MNQLPIIDISPLYSNDHNAWPAVAEQIDVAIDHAYPVQFVPRDVRAIQAGVDVVGGSFLAVGHGVELAALDDQGCIGKFIDLAGVVEVRMRHGDILDVVRTQAQIADLIDDRAVQLGGKAAFGEWTGQIFLRQAGIPQQPIVAVFDQIAGHDDVVGLAVVEAFIRHHRLVAQRHMATVQPVHLHVGRRRMRGAGCGKRKDGEGET